MYDTMYAELPKRFANKILLGATLMYETKYFCNEKYVYLMINECGYMNFNQSDMMSPKLLMNAIH